MSAFDILGVKYMTMLFGFLHYLKTNIKAALLIIFVSLMSWKTNCIVEETARSDASTEN